MKTLSGTSRRVVIVALALGSVAAIALAKEKGAPRPPKYPFHVVFKEARCDKATLQGALAHRPRDSHKIKYDEQPISGGALPSTCPESPGGNRPTVNVTQQAAFK